MVFFLVIIGIWLVGFAFAWPLRRRMLATLGVLALATMARAWQLPGLPDPGGSVSGWLGVTLAFGVVVAYAFAIAWLRAHAPEPVNDAPDNPQEAPVSQFSDAELDRYMRHIMLREVGGPGQKALKEARVLVVGAGGLGAPALMYLAAAGVGTIGVIDHDEVDNSNLQRQIIHRDADIGTPKVFSAEAAMKAQNPHVTVRPYHRRLDEPVARALFDEYDLILEGSDNFDTKYLVNRVAADLGRPVVGGALSQWEGQVSVWDPAAGAPCYQCVFPEAPAPGLAPSCAEAGVIGPLPGVVGSMMAVEAVKLICGAGEPLRGRLLIYDALYADVRVMKVSTRADCPVCGGRQAGPAG